MSDVPEKGHARQRLFATPFTRCDSHCLLFMTFVAGAIRRSITWISVVFKSSKYFKIIKFDSLFHKLTNEIAAFEKVFIIVVYIVK